MVLVSSGLNVHWLLFRHCTLFLCSFSCVPGTWKGRCLFESWLNRCWEVTVLGQTPSSLCSTNQSKLYYLLQYVKELHETRDECNLNSLYCSLTNLNGIYCLSYTPSETKHSLLHPSGIFSLTSPLALSLFSALSSSFLCHHCTAKVLIFSGLFLILYSHQLYKWEVQSNTLFLSLSLSISILLL